MRNRPRLLTFGVLAGALIASLTLSGAAAAQCRLNLAVVNEEAGPIYVLNGRGDATAVRVRGYAWRALRQGAWFQNNNAITVLAGRRRSDVYRAALRCGMARQFRIEYRCATSRETRVVHARFSRDQDVTVRLSGLGCR